MATPRVSPEEAKTCWKCRHSKPLSEFGKNRSKTDGLAAECKPCSSALNKVRYANNRAQRKDSFLQKTYGISLEDYDRLLDEQGDGCAICAKTPEENGQRLAVDHNHATGEVRGLLCSQCNKGIGNLGDSVSRLRAAIRYLNERGSYGDHHSDDGT